MNGRVIFGGSFDPPTLAHLDFIEKLSKYFSEVVIMPSYISPFKEMGASLDGQTRYELLKSETAHLSNVIVSDFELKSKGKSYTYKTAQAFSSDNVPLYFAIGSDILGEITSWTNPDILAQALIFYLSARPHYPIRPDELNNARKIYRVEVAPFSGIAGSSTEVKIAQAFGCVGNVVSKRVATVIVDRKLYRDYEYITKMYNELGLSYERQRHIYGVACASAVLAKKNRVDVDKAIRGALLHDISKSLSDEQLLTYGVKDLAHDLPLSVRHQRTGAQLAQAIFDEKDKDVLSAIAYHTTGRSNMSMLEKIIFTADYIEDGRTMQGVETIREQAYIDIDVAVAQILQATLKHLHGKETDIAVKTQEAFEFYKKFLINSRGR